MPTLTVDLVTKELNAKVRDLEVTQEYFLNLLSNGTIDMMPEVMFHLMKARDELVNGEKAYRDYLARITHDDPLEAQIERERMKREWSGI